MVKILYLVNCNFSSICYNRLIDSKQRLIVNLQNLTKILDTFVVFHKDSIFFRALIANTHRVIFLRFDIDILFVGLANNDANLRLARGL